MKRKAVCDHCGHFYYLHMGNRCEATSDGASSIQCECPGFQNLKEEEKENKDE
jgi:hypothetical protein